MQRAIVIACAVLLISDRTHGENAFIDSAPEGYYERKSLADCPSRFYSEDVSSALGFFIFGGRRAFLKEFPHMAAIGWTDKSVSPPTVQYKCGGSLIAAKYVLTAAHCKVDDDKIPPDTVRLGDTNLATTEDDDTAQQFNIVGFTVHEKFKKNRKYYDIALIELDREARFTSAVCPICLWPLDNLNEHSASMRAIGFGFTTYSEFRARHAPSSPFRTIILMFPTYRSFRHESNAAKSVAQPLRLGICSGALIDYRHVVTSATCAVRNNQQPAFIEANNELVEIVGIDVHPKFVAGKSYHNLAVLTLGKFYNPNKIYQIIAPGCIWKEERITDPIVFFSGYGPEVKNQPADVAKNVSLKILVALVTENGRCEANEAWKVDSSAWTGFNSDFLCTYNPIDLVPGICKLEPGGAVSNFRRDNIVPYVYAINTMDEGACGGTQNLFVATRLAPFYDWIESIILRHLPENDPIFTSIRFGGDDSDTDPIDVPKSNEIQQIIHQNRIDVIANHIKPYGEDLMKKRPLTTKVNMFPFQMSSKSKPTVIVPPIQNTIHNNDIQFELIPSVELPATHVFQGQGSLPQAPNLHITPYSLPYTGHHFQTPSAPYGLGKSSQGPQPVDHNQLVSIIRSIELYENGLCTLPTGAPGRCLHYTRCPSMYWNNQNVDVFLRLNLIPLCNRAQQTVCCRV
uniref:Peptidase S1 domain-containing protein n=1 Tax=Anopheles epiroticus TaxID=199890 RepID=A0A182P7C8_9DIPT